MKKVLKGEKTGQSSAEWWEIELQMDSKFVHMRDGRCIGDFTLDQILEQFAPEGTKFFPMVEKDKDD